MNRNALKQLAATASKRANCSHLRLIGNLQLDKTSDNMSKSVSYEDSRHALPTEDVKARLPLGLKTRPYCEPPPGVVLVAGPAVTVLTRFAPDGATFGFLLSLRS